MIRGITLRGAVSLNVITMIGIGPLITIPLVLAQLAGPLALIGWIAGAIVALCDGLVWAELGSQYPGSGGTYAYLREIFGRGRWGRLLAFLFNWQFLLYAPFLLASGYIGFAQYLGYLVPRATSYWPQVGISIAVGVLVIVLLYRRITMVARIGISLAVVAVATLLLVTIAALAHGNLHHAFTLTHPVAFGSGFFAGLGGALYITLYDYSGYSDAALLGEEVRDPRRTIPLAIVLSVVIVGVLYAALQIGILSAIPWQRYAGQTPPADAQYVAAAVVANSWGRSAAIAVTVLVLITAFASVYGNLVGFARIPYAAARDGEFFKPFAHLHPRGQFPDVALLVIGGISLVACFFPLGQVIAILSAGIILIQGVMQIVALFVMRSRGDIAPFRMWLFPLPALVALAGWIFAFANTGAQAMAFGVGWLCVGIVTYLITARVQRAWPFAAAAAAALLLLVTPVNAQAASNGRFVYAATFFYERVPRSQWAAALQRYRALGINTIDLYAMWNWHELSEGNFDFTGRTNSRRDLIGLFKLIDADGFRIILRPGPVIRNEWRNGGYPAWLLQRPQYGMPLRDVLEGRYPATSTLQNAHSDAAAAEWMHNGLHMRYATRWLQRVLHEVSPWRRDIIAIALDDDQGAYIDNDTWPAPNFRRYITYLGSVVRGVMGPSVPLFINTYQMKVTASSPVWAWGNWYQSDAYSIGEHDRVQLEFSTGLLQTQPRRQVMISEFQAGWLQDADQPAPRPADPTNTTLGLHTLLQMGAHGVVNFPVQDTLNPAGWEAPWTNAFYSWDAAYSVQLTPQARFAPVARFGELIRQYGTALAQTRPVADAAIAYMTSAYDERKITNDEIARIADATMAAQRGCRIVRITCRLIDLRYAPLGDVRQYRTLIVPPNGVGLPYVASVERKLAAFRDGGGHIVSSARFAHIVHPAAGGIANAVLLASNDGRIAFLDVVNYARTPLRTRAARVYAGRFSAEVPALTVGRRDAVLLPVRAFRSSAPLRRAQGRSIPHDDNGSIPHDDNGSIPHDDNNGRLPLREGSWVSFKPRSVPAGHAIAYVADVYEDGYPAVVFENAAVRLVISPCAGARAFAFEDKRTGENLFTTVGGLRDAWEQTYPPSARDYIAKYTHPIQTGTFNRCYHASVPTEAAARATFTYSAPDAPTHSATFERSVSLDKRASAFVVSTRARFPKSPLQRGQQLTSFALPPNAAILTTPNGYGIYEPSAHRVVIVAWPNDDVTARTFDRHDADALLTLTYARGGTRRTWYGFCDAATQAQAQAEFRDFARRAGGRA